MSTENNQASALRLIKFKTLDNNITEMTVDPDVFKIINRKILTKIKIDPD